VADGSITGTGLSQPRLIKGEMRPYQLIGVHWLVGLYENGLNGILGDEMGLGKTVQSIAMLAYLTQQDVAGPFMVVGPLSTLHNWANEFRKWAPEMDAVIYHGSKDERKELRGAHWRGKNEKGAKSDKAATGKRDPVMITSYEIVIRDVAELRKMNWKFIIIDEGHRLKNMNCRLIRELKTISDEKSCNRLLLTGTPLQNNLTELWSLLNFLLPSIFDDLDAFQSWFDFDFKKEGTEEQVMNQELKHSVVTKLHQILRPFLLRRLKQDVEIGLPKKYEYILFAWLTEWQQGMYADLLAKQLSDSAGKQLRLNNVLMQLRKCCNHPYLFEWPLDAEGNEVVDDILVDASGKMQLLDRLLLELKKQGDHQTLIFSQMTRMLDILEDYLRLRGWSFRRLDGTISAQERLQAMNEFQDKDNEIDVFLLSTRAGGLGVNLTRADTVVIFDSDWNPHMDLQAMDRAHRIGQTKTVMVYRLATAATIEEKVLHAAKQKLKLEQLVVSKGKFKDIGQKTDTSDKLAESELKDLLSFDPSKSALGKSNKVITDEELLVVLDRSGERKTGKGFMHVEKHTSAFDALAKQ